MDILSVLPTLPGRLISLIQMLGNFSDMQTKQLFARFPGETESSLVSLSLLC